MSQPVNPNDPPMTDSQIVEMMRQPHFLIGWMQGNLERAMNELRRGAATFKRVDHPRGIAMRTEADRLERTLRLGREAAALGAKDSRS